MNPAHLHLLLNHVPLIGIMIGSLVCFASFFFKNPSVRRIAFSIFIFSAVMAIPAFLTGESAEDTVKNLPGVTNSSIESHEEIASVFIWLVITLGLGALIALVTDVIKKRINTKLVGTLLFIFSMVVLIVAYQLGSSGGQIRHHEINSAVPTSANEESDNR